MKPLSLILHLIVFIESSALMHYGTALRNADVEECLMELNISQLLRLKHSLLRMEEQGSFEGSFWREHATDHAEDKTATTAKPKEAEDSCVSQNCLKPMAMALTGVPRGYYGSESHHHSYHPWQSHPEEKPSKLTALLNITITALAFFAFGGYLLCLIIHAIKSKGATYFYPIVTTPSTTEGDGDGTRIKIYRRGRRAIKQQAFYPAYAEYYQTLYSAEQTLV